MHMENPLKELLNQFAENAKKTPGWLPLLILCYIGFCMLPKGATVLGLSLKSHIELIVPGVTLILYVLGDALDKPVFPLFRPKWLDQYTLKAQRVLSLKEGTYKVSNRSRPRLSDMKVHGFELRMRHPSFSVAWSYQVLA